MNVIATGSRDYAGEGLAKALTLLHKQREEYHFPRDPFHLRTGDAETGAEAIAREWADQRESTEKNRAFGLSIQFSHVHVRVAARPMPWTVYKVGKFDGPSGVVRRNQKMVDQATWFKSEWDKPWLCLVAGGREDEDVAHLVDLCREAGFEIVEIED